MKQRRLEQISPEEARDIAVIEARAPMRGKNRTTRRRILAGFNAMPVRQPSPCFKDVPTGIVPKTIRNKAARKSLFLAYTARATALLRFNEGRKALGQKPMEYIPVNCPGGWGPVREV